MPHLAYSSDNTQLSCQCGAHCVSAAAWNQMTEHQRLALKQKVSTCQTCLEDESRRFNTTRKNP